MRGETRGEDGVEGSPPHIRAVDRVPGGHADWLGLPALIGFKRG